jgi:hypothetical protein
MSIDHRAEAEKHLALAARHLTEVPADMRIAEVAAVIGQGHAALAANTTNDDLRDTNRQLQTDLHAMRSWVSGHIAHALVSTDRARRQAARDLAKGLDSADVNIDNLIDEHLADDGYDKTAWSEPGSTAPARDPWAPAPDITADIPEPVRLVIADRLARALLDEGSGQSVARTIAFALKNEGADLTGAIEKRITELTLGRDPSDPPF